MAKEITNATDGFIWVCPARTPRNKEQVGKHSLKLSKLSLEPPGSVPLVEGYLGRMRWSDQAAYLRFIHTLGIDSQRLKKAFRGPAEQAIGFIAFSPAQLFCCPAGSLGYKISGLDRISTQSGLIIRRRIRHLPQAVENNQYLMSP